MADMVFVRDILATVLVTLLLAKQGESYKYGCKRPGGENGFSCLFASPCLPMSWRCDGTPDCPDGSDEKACGPSKLRRCYSTMATFAPVYVTCTKQASTDCCTKTDPWGYGISLGVECCSKSNTKTTRTSSWSRYHPSTLSTKASSVTYAACINLYSTAYCTDRRSTYCSIQYDSVGCARSRLQTTYTRCQQYGARLVPCTDSRFTQCCFDGCCSTSSVTSSTTHSAIKCLHTDFKGSSISTVTRSCSDMWYIIPSCCPVSDGSNTREGYTCCDGAFTAPSEPMPSLNTIDEPNWNSGYTGYSKTTGSSSPVMFSVGGSVGFIVVLSLIITCIRVARRARGAAPTETARQGRGRCTGILVIARTRTLICGENPGFDGQQEPPTGPPQPPAYDDVAGEAPPYTESTETPAQGGDDGIPPPPSYDQVLKMEDVIPVAQEATPVQVPEDTTIERDTALLLDA